MKAYLIVAVVLAGCSPSFAWGQEPSIDLGNVTEKHEMIPMRDGTRLSTYLYFPPGEGPWPVLYEQRYADLRSTGGRKAFAKIASHGYVVAAQNFRGTHLSEGTWVGYRALGWADQQKDGYDTVEWLGTQKWSTGKVGTMGGSQAGFAQNFLAVTRPPHLVAQYMTDTGLSLYHEGYRIGGITRPERFKAMDAVCRNPIDNQNLMREWFAHPNYDSYWEQEDCTRHFDKMDVPCFTLGSWFDFMNVGSIESFIGRQHRGGPHSRGKQQLLIGPWAHGGPKDNRVGDLIYPENATFLREESLIRWFDHYLKGVDNGADRDPAVRYYVMGATGEDGAPGNQWRTAADWPVASQETSYYLHPRGHLSTLPSKEESSSTSFLSDPLHPNEIPGRAFPGAKDAQPFEKQAEVRTFTSEVLQKPIEWTGKVQAELYVASTAKDTDIIVRVSDVYPDGRSMLLIDSIRRLRYREGYEREVLLEPGKVVRVTFDVGWISQIFQTGHQIRIAIASTGAPFYEPNPNTGDPLTIDFPAKTSVAKNTVFHERSHASRILAPVVAIAEPLAQRESTPSVEWAISYGGTEHDKTRGIAVDSSGNVYLTGEFTGKAKFGTQEMVSRGSMDFFLAKVDPTGNLLWVQTGGGDRIDRGYAVTSDENGNAYVTGHFESAEAMFGSHRLKTVGDYDLFVAKYSPQGDLLWIRSGGGVGYDYGHGIASDRLGRILVTGAMVGEGTIGEVSIGHPGPSHLFVLSMDREGKILWHRTAEGKGSSSGHAIATDDHGNCYVGGHASGHSSFAGVVLTTPVGHDVLVAKLDPHGKINWLHEGYGSSHAMIHELAADGEGNVWATGMFQNELRLGDRSVPNQGKHDLLMTHFNAQGERLWTKTAGGAGTDYGLGVATDGKGNGFFTGSFTGDVTFEGTKKSSISPAADIQILGFERNGSLRWFLQAGSDKTDHAYTIVSDRLGNLYLSGACSGNATFGDKTIPNLGSNDLFLVKLRAR